MIQRSFSELPKGLQWVNTDVPPKLKELRGQVVVLFFWAGSNMNSVLALAAIKELENRIDGGLALIGIHCPKFAAEEQAGNVLKAVNRHFIRFPVASDNAFVAWKAFGIEAWPSFAVLDADGTLAQVVVGDACEAELIEVVQGLLDKAQQQGNLELARPRVVSKPEPSEALRFPSAVIEARGMVYIADTSHNRVLEVNKAGAVQRTFGSGSPGFWDGNCENSGFCMPRGLAYAENWLFVADAGNHSLRRINLFNGDVQTVVGNGRPELNITRATRKLRDLGLRYPTGLTFNGPDLYVACAGMNQIWRVDLARGSAGWFSGSGQCGLVDGEPVRSAFAQPVALVLCGNYIYVADADGSAIREVRVQTGHVQTRIGHGTYSHGFEDGNQTDARLQFPSGLAVRQRGHELWIADAMNNALRRYDLRTAELTTLKIDHPLDHPSGLCLAGNTMWIANTYRHEIVKVDLTDKTAEPLKVSSAS